MWNNSIGEQAQALRRQMDSIDERLSAAALDDAASPDRVQTLKGRLLSVREQRRAEISEFLAAQNNGAEPDADRWQALVAISRRCRALMADCLALEQSVALRKNGRATLICNAADRMAEEFSVATGRPRKHYAVISEAEHFGADASAIHLSYAGLSLWNLNRAVHEFGHLWAEEYASGPEDTQSAFTGWLVAEKWELAPAKEFFADLVATYLLGPAYACACLLLDFNPADRGSETHPSGDERAHCVLRALDRLAKDYDRITRPQVEMLATELREFWSNVRSTAGANCAPPKLLPLEAAVDKALKRLVQQIPAARYASLASANEVMAGLENGNASRPCDAKSTDILNGAWLKRRADPKNDRSIAIRATAMLNA